MQITFTRYLAGAAAALATVLAAAWLYVVALPMAFLESGYASWTAKAAMLRECQLGRVAFFGDSRVEAGIMPAQFPAASTNFGLPAGTPIEVASGVRRALLCQDLPQQVVISFIPAHFGPLENFFWINDLRYGFISPGELLAAERLAAGLGDTQVFSAATADGLSGRLRNWMYRAHFPSVYSASLVQGRLFGRLGSNRARLAEVLAARGFAEYAARPGPAPQAAAGPAVPEVFRPVLLQAALFEQTLQALQDRGVSTALLVMPSGSGQPQDAAGPGYHAYMEGLAKRFPVVRLVNTSSPFWPARLFVDGQHLTLEGARLFSARLGACLVDGRLQAGCDLEWRGTDGSGA